MVDLSSHPIIVEKKNDNETVALVSTQNKPLVHYFSSVFFLPSNHFYVDFFLHGLRSIKSAMSILLGLPHPLGPTQQHSDTPALINRTEYFTMQFSIKTAFFALAVFLPFASALAAEKRIECKPLLQSCAVDAECCADLCVAGVSSLLLSS